VILIGLIATTFLLAPPGVDTPASDVPLFLDDVSGGRAPDACVKAALPPLRDQLARDGRVHLVNTREEATVVVDVRECGSRWETKAGGEVGVGVTVGGGGSPRTAPGGGTATQVGVGVRRQLSGYVVLRARSTDRAPEFTSLPHTDLFSEAVSVSAAQLLDWVGEHAEELQPR
jgi:hypothetical protein